MASPPVPTPQRLYQGQPAATEAALYTAPASTTNNPAPGATAILKSMLVCNTTASAATLTLYIVPSGGAAGAANEIYNALSIAAGATQQIDLEQYLEAGDFLAGLQGTASALTVTLSGVTIG
ncbi:MAG: hypothetical protein M0T72_10000 [Candidatus Dormibacteraeota bacterium]|nr:hypothetical protein [Candidatus Dormibacteraeota bacterium]